MTQIIENSIKNPLKDDEQLFYLHIPKCAGTTFIGILDQRYTKDEICPEHYNLKAFQQIPDEELATYKFIRGHIPYDRIMKRLPKRPRCITFLRDPITRYISNFEMRQRVDDPLAGLQSRLEQLSLEEFMEESDLQKIFSNRETRFFGGFMKNKNGVMIPNIERAKERLAAFDFIGLVEKFDESLELLAYIFDFPPICNFQSFNVSPRREDRKEISQSALDRVADLNWADVEIYKFALDLYQNQYEQVMKEKEIQGEPELQDNERLDSLSFDFRRMDPGSGWRVGESHPDHGVIRWSGPSMMSTIHLPLTRNQPLRMKFRTINNYSMDILNSLKVSVNGINIPIKRKSVGKKFQFIFEGTISKQALEKTNGKSKLVFEVNRTNNPSGIKTKILALFTRLLGRLPDQITNRIQTRIPWVLTYTEREVGICYSWLEISPK
jgi:hypothetical protein